MGRHLPVRVTNPSPVGWIPSLRVSTPSSGVRVAWVGHDSGVAPGQVHVAEGLAGRSSAAGKGVLACEDGRLMWAGGIFAALRPAILCSSWA